MSCPAPDDLTAFADRRLTPIADAQIDAHLRGCRACSERVTIQRSRAVTSRDIGEDDTHVSPPELGQQLQRRDGDTVVVPEYSQGSLPSPGSTPVRGSSIGRYLVTGKLGEGGMGFVFAAYDPELNRRVAIKLLKVDLAQTEEARSLRERLRREARAMAQLSHPNVVTVYDVGPYGTGLYVAMEWIEGGDLFDWERAEARSTKEILAHYVEAGRGLAAAHRGGIVHRDFKPENVLIGKDGRTRVTDFGLAIAPSRASAESVSAYVAGTPGFMSPEQIRGEALDGRSDQFGFCAAVYRSLYGRPAFPEGAWLEHAQAVIEGRLIPPPANAKVPAHVWAALKRGLSTRASDRFPSMEPLLAELGRDPWVRRRAIGLGVGAALTLGGVIVGGHSLIERDRQRCARESQAHMSIWSPARRAAIEQTLQPSPGSAVAAAWEKTAARVDAYASSWIQAETEVCEARRSIGTADDLARRESLRRSEDCLDGLRHGLQMVLHDLDRGDAAVIQLGPNLVSWQDPPRGCLVAARAAPPPADPSLWDREAETELLYEEDRYAEAKALATQVAAEAGPEHADLRARALEYRAFTTDYDGSSPQDQADAYEAAMRAAELSGDDMLLARIRIYRLMGIGPLTTPERAAQLQADAEVAVERAGSPPALVARLDQAEGEDVIDRGQFADAESKLRSASDAFRELAGVQSAPYQNAEYDLIDALRREGNYPEAKRRQTKLLADATELLGAGSPDLARQQGELALILDDMDDFSAAYEQAAPALKTVEAQAAGKSSDDLAGAQVQAGVALYGLHRDREGRHLCEEAARQFASEDGPTLGLYSQALVALARDDLRNGETDSAGARAEKAVSLLLSHLAERRALADAKLTLAQVLVAAHRDADRARKLAQEAADLYGKAVDGDQAERALAQKWLVAQSL